MLISSYQERKDRSAEKMCILLNFLKEETYSDLKTLMVLFGYKNDRTLSKLLLKTERMGLIQKHIYESHLVRLSVWGITLDGLAETLTSQDKVMPNHFQPTRISSWTLDHHLDNQVTRILLERNGATDWINGDRPGFLSQYSSKHRPDGLINLPDGRKIAVETERSLKTKARYQSIMASHLTARTKREWFYVFYVTPDEARKRTLQLIFNSITHVISNKQRVPLEAKHRDVFRFYTVEELKKLSLADYV